MIRLEIALFRDFILLLVCSGMKLERRQHLRYKPERPFEMP